MVMQLLLSQQLAHYSPGFFLILLVTAEVFESHSVKLLVLKYVVTFCSRPSELSEGLTAGFVANNYDVR
jgi:hypothetical protein